MTSAVKIRCGCGRLRVKGKTCPTCQAQYQRNQDDVRGSARDRGYDHRWEQARATYLAQHPLCAECRKAGRITPASVVDHITPHRGDQRLFWDVANWQALCDRCHWDKTRRGE